MIVPTVSSSTVGPLGIAHLPRLWLKILLHAHDLLPHGYRFGSGGFDEKLCGAFGIERDALVAFIEAERPSYLSLEAWVVAHARDLSPSAVAAWNRHVLAADLPDAMLTERRASLGIGDTGSAAAVLLNDLDDWGALHAAIVRPTAPADDSSQGSR